MYPFVFIPLYKGFPAYVPHLYMYIYRPMASWEYKLLIPNMVLELGQFFARCNSCFLIRLFDRSNPLDLLFVCSIEAGGSSAGAPDLLFSQPLAGLLLPAPSRSGVFQPLGCRPVPLPSSRRSGAPDLLPSRPSRSRPVGAQGARLLACPARAPPSRPSRRRPGRQIGHWR